MARTKQFKPETHFFPKKLMETLDFIKAYPLTLMEAPSGFGKTTSLHYFFDNKVSDDAQVYWHTFTAEHSNTSWKAFCGMVAAFDLNSAKRLLEVGLPDDDTMSDLLKIFRELKCPEEIYLVLDDFAEWKLPAPIEFLTALSDHGGKGLHVVAVSQLLPKEEHTVLLPNSRFLLLRESVLVFSCEDIKAYYRQAGVLLTEQQLVEVHRITEGWIMALYLQLLYFIENKRFQQGGMEDLIHEALWNGLPEMEQELLLSLSIFPRFSLTQATTLSGMSTAKTKRLLQEKRVFVHFDRESGQFYLHSLFQCFLSEQFALLSEEKQKEIYLTGGDLVKQVGDRMNTLRFYYLSGAWERLFSMPLTSYEIADVIDENSKPMILDIIEHTPNEIKRKYPSAMVPLAFALFFLHENAKLLEIKEEIQTVIVESDLSKYQKDALSGEMELLLSFLEYNRIDAMSKRHRRALELLRGSATLINVKSTWTFGSPSVLYMFWRESGKLSEELEQMDACMPVYYTLTGGHGYGAEIVMRAEAHFMRGDLDEAERLCHKALFTTDSKHQNSIYQCGLFLLARIAILRGDEIMLQKNLLSLEERSHQNTEDLCRYTLDLAYGYLHLLLSQKEEVPSWLYEGDISDKRLVIMTQPFAHILYERILLELGEYQKVLGVGEFALGMSAIFPNLLPQVYIKLYMAQAQNALGKQSQAIAILNDALEIALPDGVYIPFVELYEGIKKLMPYTICDIKVREKIALMAGMLEDGLTKLGRKAPSLTPREKEVLLLLQEGLTNPRIAESLMISLSTVKATVSNILSKKGVSSREMLKDKKINGHRPI